MCVCVCVCLPVLASALVVAVSHVHFLSLAAQAMQLDLHKLGALVQLKPQVGVERLSWDQRTLDSLAVDAGVHGLVLVHAQAQVQKHLHERLVVQAVATATHALVHCDILGQGVLGYGVVLVDEGVDLLVLINVCVDHGLGDAFVDEHVLAVCVARQDGEGHTRHSGVMLVGWRTYRKVHRVFPIIARRTKVCFVVHEQL
jgi:hypothetical protein